MSWSGQIHGWADALLCHGTRQHQDSVHFVLNQLNCRVRQVIGRHVNGLHGGDGAVLIGSQPVLRVLISVKMVGSVATFVGDLVQNAGQLVAGLHVAVHVVRKVQQVLF